jgi:MoaA/NifB/PqqE/SkfB family radical SAM enzyme
MIIRKYLEFNITNMCNNTCLGCTRDSPFIKNDKADFDSFKQDITKLSEVLKVKKFRILGGEPLLDNRLIDFLKFAKSTKISNYVGICTNGLLLNRQNDDLFKNLDFVEVSIYENADYFEIQKELTKRQLDNKFKFKLKIHNDFRLTNLQYDNNDQVTLRIYNECEMANSWSCHTFSNGYYYKCAKPLIQKNYDKIRNINRNYKNDGCLIHQNDLENKLINYINDKTPLDHCKSCLGTSGKKFKHKMMDNKEEGLKF